MPEGVFRWVVSIGVVLACIAFVGQAIILTAVYRAGKTLQKAGKDIAGKVGPRLERFQAILDATSRILDESWPHVARITEKASVTTKIARQRAGRIGEFIDDVNARARTRIAQIDHTADETIGQVKQVSETIKSAVMRPAKEVNGILSGVKAAVSTYAECRKGRSSVDHATQDEEMFIWFADWSAVQPARRLMDLGGLAALGRRVNRK